MFRTGSARSGSLAMGVIVLVLLAVSILPAIPSAPVGRAQNLDFPVRPDNIQVFLRNTGVNGGDHPGFNDPIVLNAPGGLPSGTIIDLAVGDFDGNDRVDIAAVFGNSSLGTAGIYSNQSNGSFGAFTPVLGGNSGVSGLAVGDINLDGVSDLVVLNPQNVQIYLAPDFTNAFETIVPSSSPLAVEIGLLNSDAFPDLVTLLSGGYQITLHSPGAQFQTGPMVPMNQHSGYRDRPNELKHLGWAARRRQ